ncbi:MAG TPA: flagellar filament outer layer protein FlaA [Turneriella sp.]|nr:flagellar filament outer layer protein FlaA [Turneriella sp.]
MKNFFYRVCLFVLSVVCVTPQNADDPIKKRNPNKVDDFADIYERIYRKEMLQNFESDALEDIFEPVKSNADVFLSDELPPPITESQRYTVVRLRSSEVRRVRLEFKTPLNIERHCRAFTLWLNVEKIRARLSLIVEDREGTRYFLDGGLLEFRGWRKIRFTVGGRIRQYDLYLNEKAALKLKGIEIVFAQNYTKGKLPILLIDEIAVETRMKYQIPPALRK